MPARTLERQVKFFEIVAEVEVEENGDTKTVVQRIRPPLESRGITDALGDLEPESSEDGVEDATSAFLTGRNGFAMHSRVHRAAGATTVDVFVLCRVRAGEGGLSVVNRRTGKYTELAIADEEGFAEESHMAFFDRNVIAVVSNGQGAPGVTRIEEYLLKRIHWAQGTIRVVALAPPERMKALSRENAYTRAARVRLPATAHTVLPSGEFYSDVTAMAERRYGAGSTVDLTLKIPTYGEQEAADTLFSDFQAVVASGRAEALKLTYQDRETEQGRAVNLVNDILAYTMPVAVQRQDDDQVARAFSEFSTSRALREAYDQLRDDIEAATADGPGTHG